MRVKKLFSFVFCCWNVLTIQAQFQWTSWSRPSECSQTCGQGISSRIRECKPVDENSLAEGEDDCRGPATIEEVCIKPPCQSGSCNCGCTLTQDSGRLQSKLKKSQGFCKWTVQTKPGTEIVFLINRITNIDWKNGGLYILGKDKQYKFTEQDGVPLDRDFPVTIHSSGNVLNISLYYSQKLNTSRVVELDALYTSTKGTEVPIEDENLAATIGIAACGAVIVFAIIIAICRRMRNTTSQSPSSEKSSKEDGPQEEFEEVSSVSGSNRSSGGKHARSGQKNSIGKTSYSTPPYSTGTLSAEERERLLVSANPNNELFIQKPEGSIVSGMQPTFIPAGQGYWPVQHVGHQMVQPVQMIHAQSPISIQQLPQPALNYMIQQTQLSHHNNRQQQHMPVPYEHSLSGGSYEYVTSGPDG